MTPLLSIKNLSAGYHGALALIKVSLTLNEGETVAVVGGNGAGKTTLIRTIAGMVPSTCGEIWFQNADITQARNDVICELGLAQVPEGRQLFPDLSVEDNLNLGGALKRSRHSRRQNLERVFGLFPRLQERRRQMAGTLSGGEQQMVAIGRALMAEPKLVMMDEPSLGLSPIMVEMMFETIAQLNRDGLSILLVEQNVTESLALATRGYVLENAEVVIEGRSADLLKDDRIRRAYLGL